MSRAELLDGLRALARNVEVKHQHVVRQEPIPKPESAYLEIMRQDNSPAWRTTIYVGRQAQTRVQVPLSSIDNSRFTPGEFIELHFQWER